MSLACTARSTTKAVALLVHGGETNEACRKASYPVFQSADLSHSLDIDLDSRGFIAYHRVPILNTFRTHAMTDKSAVKRAMHILRIRAE